MYVRITSAFAHRELINNLHHLLFSPVRARVCVI